MVAGLDTVSKLTTKQKEKLRIQCLYLKQAYEIAIQKMNGNTWSECCNMAIEEIETIQITKVGNEKNFWKVEYNIQKWGDVQCL